MLEFLEDEQKHVKAATPGRFKPSRKVGAGRIGWNHRGVYWHSGHVKRFFGQTTDSANVMLLQEAGPAVPMFGSSGGGLLGALATHMSSISDEVRTNFLKATFQLADRNKNGKLSRPELGTMMRKVLVTMSGKDIEAMMEAADADKSNDINYEEFVDWMQKEAPENIKQGMRDHLNTDADLIHATFRLWDRDGDGSVSCSELEHVLVHQLPNVSKDQVAALVNILDVSDDGRVDYHEFIEFLFLKGQKPSRPKM